MASKSKVVLKNTTGSVINIGTLAVPALGSVFIWNTSESQYIALENFKQVNDNFSSFVSGIQSGDLVYNLGGVDQNSDFALTHVMSLIQAYTLFKEIQLGLEGLTSKSSITNQHGGVVFHGSSEYEKLGPGNNGMVLTSQGPGADVVWTDLGLDGYAQVNHSGTHEQGGSDEINGDQITINYVPTNYSVANDILGDHIASIDAAILNASKKVVSVTFALAQTVNNTTAYFFTCTADSSGSGLRSSSPNGIRDQNSCSPFQVPWDSTITKAILTVRGVGVQNPTVSYPVIYQADLMSVGFTSETKIADIDFSISNLFSVGTFSVGNTNYKGSVSLNTNVDEGDLLGLSFQNGTGASTAAQTKMAFVTLVLEER